MTGRYVKITEEEYKQLLEDSTQLNDLEEAGVDNWGEYTSFDSEAYEDNIKCMIEAALIPTE